MSTLLTGSTATDPTTAPTATCPADGDTGNVASVNGPFQSLLNGIAWLRAQAALWSGGTFTGAVNGVTPTAAAHLVRKDYADGLITALKSAVTTWTGINYFTGLYLAPGTVDPGSVSDGGLGYRSDLAKVRARIAGIVQSLATEAYADAGVAGLSAKSGWALIEGSTGNVLRAGGGLAIASVSRTATGTYSFWITGIHTGVMNANVAYTTSAAGEMCVILDTGTVNNVSVAVKNTSNSLTDRNIMVHFRVP